MKAFNMHSKICNAAVFPNTFQEDCYIEVMPQIFQSFKRSQPASFQMVENHKVDFTARYKFNKYRLQQTMKTVQQCEIESTELVFVTRNISPHFLE